jgi:hypothetical protein
LQGWVALTDGDTVRALRLFRTLSPIGGEDHLEALCAERMVLAELHLNRGEYVDAFRAASLIDAPAGVSYALHLPGSLELRARAAHGMADERLAAQVERRLMSLKHKGEQSP